MTKDKQTEEQLLVRVRDQSIKDSNTYFTDTMDFPNEVHRGKM
jgi:hypothetical protein